MENYEEKFKQRLEKAKKYMSYHNDGIKECLIDIFPELAESEDEKIRKEIIGHFEKHLECSEEYGKDVLRSWIAWLEKQKELNDKEDGDFTIYHPVKNWNGEYECIPYSFYGTLSSFSEDKDIMDFLRSSFYSAQECIEWIEKQGEQKPAEWSEEDEKIFTTISNLLWDGFKANERKLTWYEIRSWLLQRVHQQPQSHWKPSNEQMEIIKMVLTDETMDDNVHSILESLYNDLEKLM